MVSGCVWTYVHACIATLGEWRSRAEGAVRDKLLQACVGTKKNQEPEMRPWRIPSFQI